MLLTSWSEQSTWGTRFGVWAARPAIPSPVVAAPTARILLESEVN